MKNLLQISKAIMLLCLALITFKALTQNPAAHVNITFRAYPTDSVVHLIWENNYEGSVREVILETSADGINFTALAKAETDKLIDIHSNNYPAYLDYYNNILLSSESGTYRYIYNDVLKNKNDLKSYRVKMVSKSGEVYNSQTLSSSGANNNENNSNGKNESTNKGSSPKGGGGIKTACPPIGTVPPGFISTGQTQTQNTTCCSWIEELYNNTTTSYMAACGGSYSMCCSMVPGGWTNNEGTLCPTGFAYDPCCVHNCSEYMSCSCQPWLCCNGVYSQQWIVKYYNYNNTFTLTDSVTDVSYTGNSDGTAAVFASGGVPPYSYIWNTGAAVSSLTGLAAGVYLVTVTDSTGCQVTDSLMVKSNPIKGNVYNDINNNGVKDTGEAALPNILIKTLADGWYFNTDSSGNYTAFSSKTTDTLVPFSQIIFNTVAPLYHVAAPGDSGKNFGYHTINVQDLMITITNLTPARPGQDDRLRITYKNTGNVALNGYVTLDFDNSMLTYYHSSPAETGISGNLISWDFTNLVSFEQRNIDVWLNVMSTVTVGSVLNFTGKVYPVAGDTTPANNHNSIGQIVITSFDPNNKEVIPDNGLSTQELANGDKLIYTLHFQNTGNDTAYNIKIVDTLSPNLDISTFHILSSSHPCSLTMHGAGIVEFNFPNILLPDSNINYIGSLGFVKYSVKPINTLLPGDSVTNVANIYFDYNSAVTTNIASTIIYTNIGINEETSGESFIRLLPNPVKGILYVEHNLPLSEIPAHCKVYNVYGGKVFDKIIPGTKFTIDTKGFAKGLYFLRVQNDEGVAVKKFVKE